MAFDFKKEFKDLYMPPRTPHVITVPPMNFVAVRGKGDPNVEGGEYQAAIGLLYGITFTIKMSYKGGRKIDGFYEYAVPPLEGFWHMDGVIGVDVTRKDKFEWLSVMRLPEFVTKEVFDWAAQTAAKKKNSDFSKAEFVTIDEGMCVQCMHIGAYDDEPATVAAMDGYALSSGYELDFSVRRHHEIYLGDPRKCAPENLRTVLRHPIKPSGG